MDHIGSTSGSKSLHGQVRNGPGTNRRKGEVRLAHLHDVEQFLRAADDVLQGNHQHRRLGNGHEAMDAADISAVLASTSMALRLPMCVSRGGRSGPRCSVVGALQVASNLSREHHYDDAGEVIVVNGKLNNEHEASCRL
jgi:hypothetical protein